MYIIAILGREDEGAYSVVDETGTNVLYIFEEYDDAERFCMMLETEEFPKMSVMEVEQELIVNVCAMHGYKYVIFTKEDIVIPPYDINGIELI